ncbi:hypothetical protein MAPG_01606 [Magnaporthiopsis poae ATCC 64411]|uniref:Uncharacterized protein n=1 Tax=Magnaporthiopsis poae (strain ATCC 64411 / 73-15) TaxID=644358 RepID=A0A0C4DP52_MAGP6|nr:hypothetical protein MAPG_01606 [Magnaporthiopsis poae ATCC 64411]
MALEKRSKTSAYILCFGGPSVCYVLFPRHSLVSWTWTASRCLAAQPVKCDLLP